jgi:hypothetical protein
VSKIFVIWSHITADAIIQRHEVHYACSTCIRQEQTAVVGFLWEGTKMTEIHREESAHYDES